MYPHPDVQSAIAAISVQECIQRAGEAIYIPAGWHHAVVNIGETVALAVQKSGPGGAWEGTAVSTA